VAEFNAPVGGEIIAVNEKLTSAIETVAKDPFGEGWITKIKMSNPAEAGSLLDDAGYDGVCAQAH
jgi:glycine cleavage system H protein